MPKPKQRTLTERPAKSTPSAQAQAVQTEEGPVRYVRKSTKKKRAWIKVLAASDRPRHFGSQLQEAKVVKLDRASLYPFICRMRALLQWDRQRHGKPAPVEAEVNSAAIDHLYAAGRGDWVELYKAVLAAVGLVWQGSEVKAAAASDATAKPVPAAGAATAGESPRDILFGWGPILDALGRKNEPEERRRVSRLNKMQNGPIMLLKGRGSQAKVDKAELVSWWNTQCDRHSVWGSTRDARLERRSGAVGQRLYDGKRPFGQVKENQRPTGHLSRGDKR